jgi:hypothetical protein
LAATQERAGSLISPQPSDWQQLAEQASIEMDPSKLAVLVTELNCVLREGDEKSIQRRHQGDIKHWTFVRKKDPGQTLK